MKDDFFQDEKTPSSKDKSENSSSVNDDSLDWAKQAYLQLKQKQIEEKELRQKEIDQKVLLDSRKNIKDDFKSNISVEGEFQTGNELKDDDEPELGDFDDTFTWSAEVLAAQGKKN